MKVTWCRSNTYRWRLTANNALEPTVNLLWAASGRGNTAGGQPAQLGR